MIIAVVVLLLTGNSLFTVAVQLDDGPIEVHQTNRSSKELQEESRSIEDPAMALKTTGRKLSPDDYSTYSTLTSDVIVETPSSSSVSPKTYPSLTTNVPTFVTRGRYIRNPFYFAKDDQEVEFDEDQHTDLLLNGGLPKRNRYSFNHRQLNKYGPTPIEADITVDEDGSTGYGSAFEYGGGSGSGLGGGGGGFDSGGFKGTVGGGGGDGMMGWFSEPIAQSSRPVPIIAEIRHPSSQYKMSMDMSKIGMLALLKIAVAKLKALGFIKAMLLVLFKLKLLLLVLAIKSLLLVKFVKLTLALPALLSLLMFPMMFSRLSRLNSLLNSPVLVPTGFPDNTPGNRPGGNGGNGGGGGGNGGGGGDDDGKRRSSLDPLDALDPSMTYFRRLARTEKCVERVSCRMAGAPQPSLPFIWLNWIVSPVSKYIPSKKIRSFVSTFTEVTNYRLDNLYSSLLPSDWTQWCNDHYSCERDKNKT